jgi:uncharacterized protein YfbU (UPF0304 family)
MSQIIVEPENSSDYQRIVQILESNQVPYKLEIKKMNQSDFLELLNDTLKQGPQRENFQEFLDEFEESRKDRKII